MKKFNWRLQRIFEIKSKQEQMARVELMEITEKIVAIRHAIILRKSKLKNSLSQFGMIETRQRLSSQELFLRSAGVISDQIALLGRKMAEFEEVKKQKMAKMMELRRFRQNLEKLREGALEKYREEFKKAEQHELDEVASISDYSSRIAVKPSTGLLRR